MKADLVIFLALTLVASSSLATQGPDTLWTRTYGGTADEDHCAVVIPVRAGGYALGGVTRSYGAGNADMWLVRINANGDTLWTHTYGGWSSDDLCDMVETSTEGFAMVAGSYPDGYQSEVRLVITDPLGNVLHDVMYDGGYGGAGNDYGHAIVLLPDSGFALAGRNTLGVHSGPSDFWLIRTDSAGNLLWERKYGGPGDDICFDMILTGDGGLALAGYTNSFGAGNYDLWLLKTNSTGDSLWSHTYGGTVFEGGYDGRMSVRQTTDEGFVLAGYTESFGTGGDMYLVRTDGVGNIQWQRTYGGPLQDRASAVCEMPDGGFALAGASDIGGPPANFYLVRTDANGNLRWSQTYGGTQIDVATSFLLTLENNYLLAGYTNSYGAGGYDFYLIKTRPDPSLLCGSLSGTLSSDAYSPYSVTCNLLVPAGDTLVIEPGVRLQFMGPYKLEVRGTLIAEGTEQDSIIFWADTLQNPNRWHGVRFENAEGENRLTYCKFLNGDADGAGEDGMGGGLFSDSSQVVMRHCLFANNRGILVGGVNLRKSLSGSLIDSCAFVNNTTGPNGGPGALRMSWNSAPVSHSLFVGNRAKWGGAVEVFRTNSTFLRCTFVDNQAASAGAISLSWSNESQTYNSCIFSQNGNKVLFYIGTGDTVSLVYSDVVDMAGGFSNHTPPPGFGVLSQINANGDSCDVYHNIFLDPRFVNSGAGDYHLRSNSPCIDAGDPTLFDPDCTPSDIGAFYYFHLAQPESLIVQQDGHDVVLHWSVVDSTECGFPTPIRSYVIYYEQNYGESWDFLAAVTDTTYRHRNVVLFAPRMYYEVVATDVEIDLIYRIAHLGMSRDELVAEIRRIEP